MQIIDLQDAYDHLYPQKCFSNKKLVYWLVEGLTTKPFNRKNCIRDIMLSKQHSWLCNLRREIFPAFY